MGIKRFHMALLFLLATFSSLFHATYAQSGAQPPVPSRASNEGANTTLPMLLVLFVFASFITCFCSFYVRYCSERYVVTATTVTTNGVDPEVLATCPIVVYSAVKKGHHHVAMQCAVCLGEFGDLDALRLLPKCSHVFHTRCIDTWLSSHVTCPICRGEIVAEIGCENGACQVFGESSVRRIDVGNGSGVCGNVDGCVGKGNGSSKVGAFGVLVRSHSTGHSLVEPEKSEDVEVKMQIVEDKGGNLMIGMKRSASYDVVLRIEEVGSGKDEERGEGSSRKGRFGWGCSSVTSPNASTTCPGISRFWASSVVREDIEFKEKTIFQIV
ncbi:Zinc finger, RING-type [Sesbania bispinosa]|nr:Zinc finger, RING-type [Sesbania bispinosa]